MKYNLRLRRWTITLVSALLLGLACGTSHAGEVLVKLKAGVPADRLFHATQKGSRKGFRLKKRFHHLFSQKEGEVVLVKNENLTSRELLERLKKSPEVDQVSLNYRRRVLTLPNDPLYSTQWYAEKIEAPEAWSITRGSREVVVMVLDSGIEPSHQDLKKNLWSNPDDPPNGYDDDKNGYVDDTHGIDAISNTGMVFDGEGHGTHVAGTIGAEGNNGKGIAGMNWQVSLVSCRFIDATGYGSDSDAITCLDYAAALKRKGVNIVAINASWGGYQDDPLLKEAIERTTALGIALIAAAGNEMNNNDAVPMYPASYQIPGVVSVASFGKSGRLSYFSNTGPGLVDLAAPGEQIVSTYQGIDYSPEEGDLFYDPCNSNWSKWNRTGSWQVTGENSHDGGMAWSDSPYGDYQDNCRSTITSPEINLSMAPGNCVVGFWAKTSLENGYDYLLVQVSRDNFKWTTIGALTGTTLAWKKYAFYIPEQLKSRTLRIRFKMFTDESMHYDGVYLDDIGINCGDYTGDEYKTLSGTSMATPVVTGALALLAARYPDEPVNSLIARLLSGVDKDQRFSEVTSSGGTLNLRGALEADPAPLITKVSPEYATTDDNLTIEGLYFGEEGGDLWFETSDGSRRIKGEVLSWSNNLILAKPPQKSASYLRIERSDGTLSPRFLVKMKNLPLPLPAGPKVYQLCLEGLPSSTKMGNDPATTVPFSLGEDSYTTMHLMVEIPQFEEPVDVYVAIQGLSWSTNDPLFFITADSSGQWHTYNDTSPVLAKYAENSTGPISAKDLLAPGIPAEEIPLDWELRFYLAVVPAGSTDWSRFYLWWVDWY